MDDARDVGIALAVTVVIGVVGTAIAMGAQALGGTALGLVAMLAYVYVVVLTFVRLSR